MFTEENVKRLSELFAANVIANRSRAKSEKKKFKVYQVTHLDADGIGCVYVAKEYVKRIMAQLAFPTKNFEDIPQDILDRKFDQYVDWQVFKWNYTGPLPDGEAVNEADYVLYTDLSVSSETAHKFLTKHIKRSIGEGDKDQYFEWWDHHRVPQVYQDDPIISKASGIQLADNGSATLLMDYAMLKMRGLDEDDYKDLRLFYMDLHEWYFENHPHDSWIFACSLSDTMYANSPDHPNHSWAETIRRYFAGYKVLLSMCYDDFNSRDAMNAIRNTKINGEFYRETGKPFLSVANYIRDMAKPSRRWLNLTFKKEDGEWTNPATVAVQDATDDQFSFSAGAFNDVLGSADIVLVKKICLDDWGIPCLRVGAYAGRHVDPREFPCNEFVRALANYKCGGGHIGAAGAFIPLNSIGSVVLSDNEFPNVKVMAGVDNPDPRIGSKYPMFMKEEEE